MKELNACIITIGDELLIGQTIDTNSAFISQQLNRIGIWVKRRIAIGDVKEEIIETIRQQGKDCAVLIITGGLGPTNDDITKTTLCEYFGSKLVTNQQALDNVVNIFTKLNKPVLQRNLTQAEVPNNCIVLQNPRGTAPGMWFEGLFPSASGIEKQGKTEGSIEPTEQTSDSFEQAPSAAIVISLPGVPDEMKGLMEQEVIPRLTEILDLPCVLHRTLLTAGVGESTIADTIIDFENNLPPYIKLAYLPAYGQVRLRLTGRSNEKELLEQELNKQFAQLKTLVQQWMVADTDISLVEAVSKLLHKSNKTVATAESCTGGHIAQLFTSLPGSSAIYNGSVVAYAYEAKEDLLNVQKQTLQQHGAVSEETVTEMLKGALNALNVDYAIATSGIMGPGGGTADKPVGTVWMAVGNRKKIVAVRHHFRFHRQRNIEMAAQTALTLSWRFISEQEGESLG